MISSKFYSQTNVCQLCKGWGTENFPPTGKSPVCRDCEGRGVTVNQSDSIFLWNAPAYIDYARRNFVFILKTVFILLAILLVVMFLLILRSILAGSVN